MNARNIVCKVLVRTLPVSLTPGKGMAQTHHAGTHLVAHWQEHAMVKAYLKSGNGFGTTITLKAANPRNDEIRIRELVQLAKSLGYVADLIIDPSYPIVDGFCTEAMTCGYILHEEGDTLMETVLSKNEWVLY